MATANLRKGYLLGLATFSIWGMFPLYFKALEQYGALEIVTQRVIWSAVFGSLVLLVWRHPGWWRELLAHPRRLGVLGISSVLIAANWLIYVWAVNHDRMVEASLGYYINPLVNVLLGMLVLRERLRPLQWLAVAMATVGVSLQLLMLGEFPWISLVLALSFGTYGLLRKQAPVAALPGLVVETWLLLPVALIWLFWFGNGVLDQHRCALADGGRPGDPDPPARLQRRRAPPALFDTGLPAIPDADAAADPRRAAVWRAIPGRSPAGLLLHLGRPRGIQPGRLAGDAQKHRLSATPARPAAA